MTVTPIYIERTPSLYQLTEAYLRLTDHLESDDYAVEDVAEELRAIAGSIRDKGEAIACVNQELERRAETCKLEAKRLTERARRAEAHAEWLRLYAMEQLKAIGLDRLDTPRFTLAIRTNPPAVNVLDAAAVPGEYQRTKITIDVDKRSVLADFKITGEIPNGVEITRGQRLEIA